MIYVPSEVVNLFIGVWAETWRGRLDSGDRSVRHSKMEAHDRHMALRPNLPVEEWITIFEKAAGYEESSITAVYSGPRLAVGHRVIDDPDPRLFLYLTVERAVLQLPRAAIALADHSWIYRRGDRDFRYQPANGERNPVPVGRSKVDWCKKVRARKIKPSIQAAIQTHLPETIAEAALQEIGIYPG